MLTSVIIDDEFKSRESLRVLLHDFCDDIEVLASCKNVAEGIEAIQKYKPQVVFLDIQMKHETGFDLLSQLDTIDFEVIFTTAHSEYALKAFRFSAVDYLLKPIDIADLNRALEKIRDKKEQHDLSKRLEHLLRNLNINQNEISKIALPSVEGLTFVKINDILYCEASGNYTIFHTKGGENHMVSRTLKEYEEMLSEYNFYRIHNAYLINLNFIKKYVRGVGGHVVLNNGISLDVSKRKKEGFLQKLGY